MMNLPQFIEEVSKVRNYDISEVGGNCGDDIYLTARGVDPLKLVAECEGGYNSGAVDLVALLEYLETKGVISINR